MKKDLFVKQHFNGDGQKYPPFQPNTPFWTCFPPISIDKDGKFSCRLDVIKLHFMTNLSQFDVFQKPVSIQYKPFQIGATFPQEKINTNV